MGLACACTGGDGSGLPPSGFLRIPREGDFGFFCFALMWRLGLDGRGRGGLIRFVKAVLTVRERRTGVKT